MCDKYTISEKIELVTLISALKDYNEVINSLRETGLIKETQPKLYLETSQNMGKNWQRLWSSKIR